MKTEGVIINAQSVVKRLRSFAELIQVSAPKIVERFVMATLNEYAKLIMERNALERTRFYFA